MTGLHFKNYLKDVTINEHLDKHNWKFGLTAFWIKFFANYAIHQFHIKPTKARVLAINYFKRHRKLSHDPIFNHGGSIVDGNVNKMLYEAHLINLHQLREYSD